MTRPRKTIEAALEKKGFVKEEGDHHFFYLVDSEGKRTGVFTKTSHSPQHKDIGDPLLGQMARQVKLSKGEFLQLVDCTLPEIKYREKLRTQGVPC